jgi:hypothetical protein
VKDYLDQGTRYNSDERLAPQEAGYPPELTFTRAQWIYWRERFEIMSSRRKLAEETRSLCAQAVMLMERIEEAVLTDPAIQ